MHHFAAGSSLPWLYNQAFKFSWAADRRYLDSSSSVGIVSPEKGPYPLLQPTTASKAAYSAAYGSQSKGMLAFDAVDDHYTCDPLAALFTSLHPYTIICSFQALSISSIKDVWSFSNTSDAASGTALQIGLEAGLPWRAALQDNLGVQRVGFTDFPADTSRVVITQTWNGTNAWSIRINASDHLAGHAGTPPGATTFTKFTLGALRGAHLLALLQMNWRRLIIADAALSTPQVLPSEQFLVKEAA